MKLGVRDKYISFNFLAPEKRKIKASGRAEYSYQQLWKQYGLLYPKLKAEDKLFALSLVSESYTLHVFEKGLGHTIFIFKFLALTPDEYERFQDNPIVVVPQEIACFSRTYLGISTK